MRKDIISRSIIGLAAILMIALVGCGSGQSSKSSQMETPSETSTASTTSKLIKISGNVDTGVPDGSSLSKAGLLVTAYRMDVKPQLKKGLKKTVQISDGVYQTTTDSTGYYELDIPPADYTIVVEGPSHKKAMRTLALIAAAPTSISLDFVLTATGNITGKIVQSGHPWNGANTYIPGTRYIAITDENGNFNLSDVPVGTYLINLAGILQSVTLITGTLDIGTIDIDGIPPQVTYTYPASGGTTTRFLSEGDWPGYMLVSFSHIMNPETVKKAVSITTPNNIPIQWDISESSWCCTPDPGENYMAFNSFMIRPAAIDEYSKLPVGDYTVTISTAATATNGKTLERDYTFTVTLIDKIIGTTPQNGAKEVSIEFSGDNDFPVEMDFSTTMNRGSVRLSIDPPVPGMITGWERKDRRCNQWYYDDCVGWEPLISHDKLWVYGSFAQNTTYTVSVTEGATSAGAALTGLPSSFTFTTVEPKVLGTTPVNGATDVPKNNQVSIAFNTVMDRDSVEKGLTVKEGNNPVSNVKLRWDNGDNWDDSGWKGSDNLLIDFPKTFGKVYTIAVTGARTSQGNSVVDYTFSFTTLIPRIISSSPSNGDIDPLFGPIEIRPNVPLDTSTANKTNIRVIDQDNNPVDIDISFNEYNSGYSYFPVSNIYVDPRSLKSSTLYTVSIQGLKSVDGITLPDYVFTFQTPRRLIWWDYPWHGQTNVENNMHSVEVSINDYLTDGEKAAIESSIVVTARTYNDNQGINETHPIPQFLWAKDNHGYSRLYIGFTFDEATNYRLWTKDSSGNPTQEIRDSSGNLILFVDRYLEFSTQSSASVAVGKPNLVYEVLPRDGSLQVDPNNTQLKVVFGTVILESGLRINVYEDGLLVPSDIYSISLGTENRTFCYDNPYGGQNCDWRSVSVVYFSGFGGGIGQTVNYLNLKYNRSYRVEVLSAISDPTCGNGWNCSPETINNLPYSSTFTTGGPVIYVSVDNSLGKIEIGSGDALMDSATLQSAFSTAPQVVCSWEMDSPYTNWATCNYSPIQYANIRVDIAPLMSYEGNPDTGEVTGIGAFGNTPISEVFTMNPDITLPVLNSVTVSENVPGDHTTISLSFNTFLDRESVMAGGAFSITDSNGVILNVSNVNPGPNRWAESTIQLTTEPLSPGATYTLAVTGVKEFGGRYTIDTATAGTQTFTYNGRVVKVTGIRGYYDADGDGQSQEVRKFAIYLNVPMKGNDLTYDISNSVAIEIPSWCSGGCYPFASMGYEWNATRDILLITAVYEEGGYGWYYNVNVLNTALNLAGNSLDNTPFATYINNMQSASLNVANPPGIVALSATQVQVNLQYWYAVDNTALNPLNYTLRDSSGNTMNVIGAFLNTDGTVITLDLDPTTPMTNNMSYYLTVSNVRKLDIDFPADHLGIVLNNYYFWTSGI